MEKYFISRVAAVAVACFSLLLMPSCINSQLVVFEEKELDATVQVFQEGLKLPLGSLDTIKVKDLMARAGDDLDEFLNMMDGAYSFGIKDTLDMSDTLNKMLKSFKIEAVEYDQEIDINLESIDVSDVKVQEMTFPEDGPYEVYVSEFVEKPELPVIDPISISKNIDAEISKYLPDMDKLTLPMSDIVKDMKLVELPEGVDIPPFALNDTPLKLDLETFGLFGINFHERFEKEEVVELNLELPEGLASVDEIILDENAAIEVSIEMVDPILISGKIRPEIILDLNELLNLSGSGDNRAVIGGEDFVLSPSSDPDRHFKATKRFGISSLAISKDDWTVVDGKSVLKEEKRFVNVPMTGNVVMEDCYTTTRLIQQQRHVEFIASVRFIDFRIKDVAMTVDDVDFQYDNVTEFSFAPITLPEMIKSVDYVSFDEQSVITLSLIPENLSKLKTLDTRLDELTVVFPEGLVIKDLSTGRVLEDNTLALKDINLKSDFIKQLQVVEFNLPSPDENHTIAYNGEITMNASLSAGGQVRSSELPVRSEDDVRFDISVTGNLNVDDYQATISRYEYDFAKDFKKQEIEVELPDEIADLKGSITVYPEGQPVISMNIVLPELPENTDIEILADNFKVDFPDMIRFVDVPSEYNYDQNDHSITINGEIPSEIRLKVGSVVITPVFDQEKGKYFSRGELLVSGGIVVSESAVRKADVEKFTAPDSKISVSAHVPEIRPSNVDIDTYTTSLEETLDVDFDLSENEGLDMIKEIGMVNLKDVFISVELDAQELMQEIDADVAFTIEMNIPEMIVINDKRVDDKGNLTVSGKLDGGKIIIDPIPVDALDLAGHNLSDGIHEQINVKGSITVSDANIGVGVLEKNHKINIEVGIKSDVPGAEEDSIIIKDVSGKVDYQLDPVGEKVDLSPLTDLLTTGNLEADLDLNRFYLALDLSTNLVVPIHLTLDLIPYYDGVAAPESARSLNLNMTSGESADKINNTKYWISNTQDGMPAGYEFIEYDILSLVRTMPDMIEVTFTGGTDAEKDIVVALDQDLVLEALYEFSVPVELGDEFEVSYRDTIPDLPSVLAEILQTGDLALQGEILNGLPLALDVSIDLLDSQNRVVELDESSGKFTVASSDSGNPAASQFDLNLKKKEGVKVNDISSLVFVVNVNSGNAAGAILKEEDFLTGKISAVLPSGITLDLLELEKQNEK